MMKHGFFRYSVAIIGFITALTCMCRYVQAESVQSSLDSPRGFRLMMK